MTDAELLAASLPAAADLLREHGLDGAADVLLTAPDLLERAIRYVEDFVRLELTLGITHVDVMRDPKIFALIAEHRKETPEATLARLSPPLPVARWEAGNEPWNLTPVTYSGTLHIDRMRMDGESWPSGETDMTVEEFRQRFPHITIEEVQPPAPPSP